MKNIILLITDTFRYDNLAQRATRPVRTPELDRFAADRATAIERFYTGSFPTIPNRTDIASGVLGWPHYGWQPIDLSGPNHMGSILRGAGYATQLICDTPHLFNARFQNGFEGAFQHRGQEGDKALLHLNDPIEKVVPPEKTRLNPMFRGAHLADLHGWTNHYPRYETEMFMAMTGDTTMRWLEENNEAGPFFLWVDFFDPHEPWNPPEYMVKRYDPDYDGTPMLHCNYGPASDYTDAELNNLWAHYAAESELVDRWLGRVLQKIDDLGLWDDSIVAVTADHGTSLGEHDRTGKSNICPHDPRFWPIYPEVGHIPLMLAGGDVPRGNSLDLVTQPIDLFPSLAELAGAEIEPPAAVDGKSFAGSVLAGAGKHRDYAVSASCTHADDDRVPRKAVTPFLATERWGYTPVGALGEPELYDLGSDPLATRDLAADNPATVAELQALLVEHLKEHGAGDAAVKLWEAAGKEAGEGTWAIDYPNKEL